MTPDVLDSPRVTALRLALASNTTDGTDMLVHEIDAAARDGSWPCIAFELIALLEEAIGADAIGWISSRLLDELDHR